MEKLLQLLEETQPTPASFKTIAEQLMNKFRLHVNGKKYRVVECEFYYFCSGHKDPFAHGHELQKTTFGQWYFHGSGLDITLGNRDKSTYGGILLRGIAEVDENDKIVKPAVIGPLNVCTELFKQVGTVISQNLELGFVDISGKSNKITNARIFAVPRIGLNPIKDTTGKFCNEAYRFVSFLDLKHRASEKIKKYLLEDSEVTLTPQDYLKYYKGGLW